MPNILGKKGVAIYLVLATVMVAVILASVIGRVMTNQGRITHHKASRIQAQYAAQAGYVYAMEMLRLERENKPTPNPPWTPNGAPTVHFLKNGAGIGLDPAFPETIQTIRITINPLNTDPASPFFQTHEIDVFVDYTPAP
jgi:type II secretory pathway pseudopilin PulG